MVTYYLDASVAEHPRLVRRINNGHPMTFDNTLGTAVAIDVENLQFTYDLADGATNASLAVPTLIKFLNDPRNRVRWTAAKALGAIGLQPHRSVPAFINALEDADWEVRYSSVTSLVVFRPEAKKAIPLLLKLKNDPVPKVQAAAAKALEEIDPTGVGSAGGIEPP